MIQKKVNEYLAWVREANTEDARELRRAEFNAWYYTLSEKQKEAAQAALKPDMEGLKQELRAIREEAEMATKGTILYEGEEYQLGEWVTIADYARLHNIKINRVTNWINRQVIPAQNVKVFPELNNLKLLRNQPYKNTL